jgi:hypothetical protein
MKNLLLLPLFVLLLLATSTTAFGWGYATHTYFAKELGASFGAQNANEMYGAVLVDAFNLEMTVPGQVMYDMTHHYPEAMIMAAQHCDARAAAFGFASHCDLWGADRTAHHHALTLPDTGYAIIKGNTLAPAIMPVLYQLLLTANPPVPDPLAQGLAYALAPAMGHDLSETAVDLMLKRREDPFVGLRLVIAAQGRSHVIPELLCTAYAQPLADYTGLTLDQARAYITQVEGSWRQQMLMYGGALVMPEGRAIQMLAQMNATVAEAYLEFFAADNGFPTDVTVTPATAETFIRTAMAAVQGDYRREVAATLNFVRRELNQRNIRTCRRLWKESDDIAGIGLPEKAALKANYPNPFNPTTTVTYDLPADQYVSLKVYNTLGQEVATLVDGIEPAGTRTAVFNADRLPSGTYFYRLQTGNVVETRKMQLVK